jgi:hypothetical protein
MLVAPTATGRLLTKAAQPAPPGLHGISGYKVLGLEVGWQQSVSGTRKRAVGGENIEAAEERKPLASRRWRGGLLAELGSPEQVDKPERLKLRHV